MRNDKRKNTIKVLKEVINNPLQSQREIAENTGLGLGTVNASIRELEQNGTLDTDEIVDFVKLDLELQKLCTNEMIKRVKTKTDEVNNQDIVRFNETSFKRSLVLGNKDKDNKIQFIIN